MVRKPPGTAVFFITLPHGSFVSIHRPGFHGGTARRSIRRPLPRRRTGGRLLPGVRQLRPQLGMPAVRVRYGGVRHALRHGAARRDQNHARGAGTPGLRSGTPDPARTAAARTLEMERQYGGRSFAYVGTCIHCPEGSCTRPEGRPCRHPELVRPSLEACGFDVARTASELFGIEMKWGSGGRMPEYLTLVCGFFHDAESVVWNGYGRFSTGAAARIRRTRRCGPSGRAHTK